MAQLFHQETTLITGASSGIGYACTLEAIKTGLKVVTVSRNTEKLKSLNNKNLQIISADISTQDGRQKVAENLSGNINYVIHNAAYLETPIAFENIQLKDFRKSIATNAEPIIFLTQKLLPLLVNSDKPSRILCISSGAAQKAIAGIGGYCISKAAGLMASEYLKQELAEKNILVNSYFPGVVDTQMQKTLRNSKPEVFPFAEEFKRLKKQNRLRSPKIVA
ncbi:MAG: SDR family NAD(P)-dependent oxidoreductase, partial [Xanthomonadales bacterium]|nr:SDR family NAD(P)-dependent oxidoreductase [Xanthomonadales bacterium]